MHQCFFLAIPKGPVTGRSEMRGHCTDHKASVTPRDIWKSGRSPGYAQISLDIYSSPPALPCLFLSLWRCPKSGLVGQGCEPRHWEQEGMHVHFQSLLLIWTMNQNENAHGGAPWVGRSATNTKQMLKAWETYTKNKSDTFKTRVRSRSQNRICSLPHHCFI